MLKKPGRKEMPGTFKQHKLTGAEFFNYAVSLAKRYGV